MYISPVVIYISIGCMVGGGLITMAIMFIVRQFKLSKEVNNAVAGVFGEPNGELRIELMKLQQDREGSPFVQAKNGALYRVPEKVKHFLKWPIEGSGPGQREVAAAIWVRGNPNSPEEEGEVQMSEEERILATAMLRGLGRQDAEAAVLNGWAPRFLTALAVFHLQRENIAKQAADAGDAAMGGGKKVSMSLILAVATIAAVLIGVYMQWDSGRKTQAGLLAIEQLLSTQAVPQANGGTPK